VLHTRALPFCTLGKRSGKSVIFTAHELTGELHNLLQHYVALLSIERFISISRL